VVRICVSGTASTAVTMASVWRPGPRGVSGHRIDLRRICVSAGVDLASVRIP
jgi:hypothetical protein